MKNKKYLNNPILKSVEAANLCLDEWYKNYNNPQMIKCKHNKILPKIGLCLVTIALILTIVTVI